MPNPDGSSTPEESLAQLLVDVRAIRQELDDYKAAALVEFANATKVSEFHTAYQTRMTKLEQDLNKAFMESMGNSKSRRDISESKVLSTLPTYEGKDKWREWVTKMITAMDQFRPGSRAVIDHVIRTGTEDWTKASHDLWLSPKPEQMGMYEPMNRDMWWIMTQKTASEAYGKVMAFGGSEGGNGLDVFMKLYRWYTKIAQVSVDELRDKCSGPPRASKMEDIPGIIERWKQHVAHLEQVDNADPFTEKWRITAIRKILCGKIREHVEWKYAQEGSVPTEKGLLGEIRDYLASQRISRNPDDMDINNLKKGKGNGTTGSPGTGRQYQSAPQQQPWWNAYPPT